MFTLGVPGFPRRGGLAKGLNEVEEDEDDDDDDDDDEEDDDEDDDDEVDDPETDPTFDIFNLKVFSVMSSEKLH